MSKAAEKPTTTNVVVTAQINTSLLYDNSDLLGHLSFQACVELTRRLLGIIFSIPTGAARPRAVLKTVITFVIEYGSAP